MSIQYYNVDIEKKQLRLEKILDTLPTFIKQYFYHIIDMSINTRLSYAYNIRTFCRFLIESERVHNSINEIQLHDFNNITNRQIQNYRIYLNSYTVNGKLYENGIKGIRRNIVCLSSMYKYFNMVELLTRNPFSIIVLPKLNKKNIIYLNLDEINNLLSNTSNYLNKKKQYSRQKVQAYNRLKYRDFAIITLLLTTGIRVSECVSLDLRDFEWEDNRFSIIGKGGDEATIIFGNKTKEALLQYINLERPQLNRMNKNDALFLNQQGNRLGQRGIQFLVKKYKSDITEKEITPHKLRSTAATQLYDKSKDIYKVSNFLRHKNINTAAVYAAVQDKSKMESAALLDEIL